MMTFAYTKGMSSYPLPPDPAPQEAVAQRREACPLGVVLAVAMPSRSRFIEIRLVPQRLELGRHFAGMAGMDAVVAAGGGDQDRGVVLAGDGGVVGGHGAEEGPVLRVVGVAVLGHPARPGEQFGVAAHVDQRDGAEQRAEALRVA